MLWRLVKFLYRIGLCVWIFMLCTTHYYCHVYHLYNNLKTIPLHVTSPAITRYEILVGEPTCVVLSNPWLCLAFVVDICASTEYVGQACLRVCQTENWFYFGLGLLYLGRTVWCAYSTLTILNIVLKRCHRTTWFAPANTTVLAVAATWAGGGIVTIQKQWPKVLDLYTSLFLPYDVDEDVSKLHHIGHMDIALIMAVYLGTMGNLPFAVAGGSRVLKKVRSVMMTSRLKQKVSFVSILIATNRRRSSGTTSSLRRLRSIEMVVEPPKHMVESSFHYNDFKHRLMLWFCNLGHLKDDMYTGGSVYPLFQQCPDYQSQCTISQRGGDCYVLSYDRRDDLVEVTRVTLVSQIDLTVVHRPFRINQLTTNAAVGRFVVAKKSDAIRAATLHRGCSNSPWVS
ncbi:hypothetical protein AaE_009258 [Aphanomyces astaci]|uniref:Uncharacterized protein n=2 Tax=Aphanomyces astaci TaxID=112090 RepID=A0A6A5ACX9_APHAT|nr:hypothetical protein AaE_009258 [Aphanomyces astaci]